MGFMGKQCQSCGMPLKKDEQGGGTEVDGSKSQTYCSHCYQSGVFIEPNITAIDMKKKVEDKICEMGMPRFLAKLFSRQVPKLQRWNK